MSLHALHNRVRKLRWTLACLVVALVAPAGRPLSCTASLPASSARAKRAAAHKCCCCGGGTTTAKALPCCGAKAAGPQASAV